MIKLVTNTSSAESKVALFRSLFQGREDVYPVRFESQKTGRSGYAPACSNEWARGVCEKPRIKCAACPDRKLLPVTDEVIRWHLSGMDERGRPFVIGVYPMLQDETCRFLAVDFDGDEWRSDAQTVLGICNNHSLPGALERSRSGDGGHVWFFFEETIPARLARNLGSFLLTAAMELRPEIGLKSYDRLFPNQDTLPKGGFGNLIALPLQKQSRLKGNSLFVDEGFTPYPDQWAFLSSIKRVTKAQCEALVQEGQSKGRIIGVRSVLALEAEDDEPWTAPPSRKQSGPPITEPLPSELELVLGDHIYIPKEPLPAQLRNRLVRLAAFQNPEFYRAQSMRLPVYDKPRILQCAEDHAKHIALPRGLLGDVEALLRELKVKPVLRDERIGGASLKLSFKGELRPEQLAAAKAMLAHDTGVLAATTAFGKTVLAAWLIAQRGVNTLVLVHRQQLLTQCRLHEQKHEVRVYDYADLNVPMMARMFDRRCEGYEAVGYEIQLPGSAVPGWPAEVTLPIAPEWKRDYAASVRRLIIDGVDVPLADLFLHAAAQLVPTDDGYAHARSATEAFLFRRLQTLPLTAGRFRLNARLPIQFDDHGEMEVDLLSTEERLAIELDGPQHLSDPDAYRRDRRKDFLLQENRYLVLRFLSEDVAKRLDNVLDTVTHALAGRIRQ